MSSTGTEGESATGKNKSRAEYEVNAFLPKRYLSGRDDEPSAGFFSIGWIQDIEGEWIRDMKYAEVIKGLSKRQLRFEILVSGKRPPVDELWNRYLVASPEVAKTLKKEFGRQLECIETEAVDEETGTSFAMVFLKPTLEAKCFIKTQRVKWTKDGGRIEDHLAYGRTGFPQTYVLSSKVLGKADIALVVNAPEPVLVLSERFKNAILAAIPRSMRHLKHIEFRNYKVRDERPAPAQRTPVRRSARKTSGEKNARRKIV